MCVDCHSQKLSEQLTEGVLWLTGNYTFPLEKRQIGTRSFCLTEGCHVEAKIIEATTGKHNMSFAFSQHDPQHGKQQCYTCHFMHGQSVFFHAISAIILTCRKDGFRRNQTGWLRALINLSLPTIF